MQRLLLGAFLLATVASATGHGSAPVTRASVLKTLLGNAHLKGVPASFECEWRSLALEYALTIQPSLSPALQSSIHDGLELSTLCNKTFAPAPPGAPAPKRVTAPPASSLFVDFTHGDDSAAGSQASPLKTIAAAVTRARTLTPPVALILRGGVHRLDATVSLGAQDSGLSIEAFAGETPVVSSGLVLAPKWAYVPTPPTAMPALAAGTATRNTRAGGNARADCVWTSFAGVDAMYDDWPSPSVANLSSTASADACEAACRALPSCTAFIWYAPAGAFGAQWDGMCFSRSDGVWDPSPQHDSFSGYCATPPPLPNIWVADLKAAGTPVPDALTRLPGSAPSFLISPDGGSTTLRTLRARWPNADAELDLYPKGWASGGARSGAVCDTKTSTAVDAPLPANYGPGMFSDYRFGSGGNCDRFEVGEWLSMQANVSYWCQPDGRTAGCTYYPQSPSQISLSPAELPHAPYTSNVTRNGATFHYWRQGHWFSMMTKIDGVLVDAANTTTLSWTHGAFQGAEGDSQGEDWYVENIREELDSPRETFLDTDSQLLYYFHNDTQNTPPPASWTWEVPSLQVLFNISGSPSAPARNISITGLTFTSAAATYLAPHGIPSGGDWGLSRLGALLVTGAEGLSVSSCTFTRLDGNAISLNGYTRDVSVIGNEFVWLGESALASWGYTDGVDATAGTQPWRTRFVGNVVHEIGIYEKQVSGYFAAVSAFATIEANIMYNMPRAAVNFNDDMAGGSLLTRNLIWNTCRESQDHGPFNSWGRVPYLFPFPNGTSNGVKPNNDELSYNFIVAGGGANGGAFDHDDGSSYYLDHHNFEVYGGHKSDFDGHGKRSYSSIHAFAYVYGTRCAGIFGSLPHKAVNDFFAEGYFNNRCILPDSSGPYLDLGSDCAPDATLANRMIVGNNTVYLPNAAGATVTCGKTYTMADWLALGVDVGTSVADTPVDGVIVGWARELLGIARA